MHRKAFILSCLLLLGAIARAEVRIAVIPVEFSDCKFTCPRDSLTSLCKRSEDYFNRSLHDKERFSFILLETYSSSKKYAVYGANSSDSRDSRFPELAYNACVAADSRTDFSSIDHILFITAGENEAYGASSDWFWPCCETFPSSISLILDGKQFKEYAKACELGADKELCGHGLLCHEAGHLIGLPDLYDTDGDKSGGTGIATYGYLSLMDKGDTVGAGFNPPLLNSIELDHLGYGSPLSNPSGQVSLSPVEKTGSFIKIDSKADGQYYLLENRQSSALAAYLVDVSDNNAGFSSYYKKNLTAKERWKLNEVNCNPEHQCAYAPIEPMPVQGGAGYLDLNGAKALRNIRQGQDSCIVLDLISPIIVDSEDALQESITFKWHSELKTEEIKSCVLKIAGKTISDAGGCFQADNLNAGCNYQYEITLESVTDEKFSYSSSASTLPLYVNSIPFIFFSGAQRNTDGSFKAGQTIRFSIYNKPKEASVSWYFNGIKVEENTGLRLDESAELKAVLILSNGSRKIISKSIRVK